MASRSKAPKNRKWLSVLLSAAQACPCLLKCFICEIISKQFAKISSKPMSMSLTGSANMYNSQIILIRFNSDWKLRGSHYYNWQWELTFLIVVYQCSGLSNDRGYPPLNLHLPFQSQFLCWLFVQLKVVTFHYKNKFGKKEVRPNRGKTTQALVTSHPKSGYQGAASLTD